MPVTIRAGDKDVRLKGALGVDDDVIFVDHGLTGANRARPGLREALAACRDRDTLVVTKLDRLARSLPDGRDIADELTQKGVLLNPGGSIYDPTDRWCVCCSTCSSTVRSSEQ